MTTQRRRQRAPNLTDADIEVINGILDGWTGRLSWNELISAIQARTRATYTRQALHQHERIRLAYATVKERLKGRQVKPKRSRPVTPAEGEMLLQRNARLEAEVERLKIENQRLLEQFLVWAYNAYRRGLDIEYLNMPLPRVDRDQTKLPDAEKVNRSR
jgi:hypothetical protein